MCVLESSLFHPLVPHGCVRSDVCLGRGYVFMRMKANLLRTRIGWVENTLVFKEIVGPVHWKKN